LKDVDAPICAAAAGDVALLGDPVRTGGDTFLFIVAPPPDFALIFISFLCGC
jgi:hypothetical protein